MRANEPSPQSPFSAVARKPFEPIVVLEGQRMARRGYVSPIKRNRGTTVQVSQQALNVIYREAERCGGTWGGVAGMVVDYLARNGKLGEVLDAALAETHEP